MLSLQWCIYIQVASSADVTGIEMMMMMMMLMMTMKMMMIIVLMMMTMITITIVRERECVNVCVRACKRSSE